MSETASRPALTEQRLTMTLPCRLSPTEFRDRATELGGIDADIKSQNYRAESARQQLKAELAELEAKRSRLSTIVARGEELRSVEVLVKTDLEQGITWKQRNDTGEVFDQRPLNEQERQAKLPLREA